jgi:hypothetical protein
LPLLLPRVRAVLLAGLLLGIIVLFAGPLPDTPPAKPIDHVNNTAYYAVRMKSHPGLVPSESNIRTGGAITRFRDGFLLATGGGEFYRLAWQGKGDSLIAGRVPLSTPINVAEFLEDQPNRQSAAIFRITDMVVRDSGQTSTLYVARALRHPPGIEDAD